jgi:hypothetical protein
MATPTSRPPLTAMKIFNLNGLVAYLTVTALPFTPFAFAHPLAASIDHDGFVNTRQNRNDGDLEKRVPGDIIEARQGPAIVVEMVLVLDVLAIIDVRMLLVDAEVAVRAMKRSSLWTTLINSILPETRGVY